MLMKLGFLTAILPECTFDELLDFAAENGYDCVEAACWPSGKAQRRYAGVSHIDMTAPDQDTASALKDKLAAKNVSISAIGYYPNPLSPDVQAREAAITHIRRCIDGAALLGVNLVNTFIGKDPGKTIAQNMEMFKAIWPEMIQYAQDKGVKIGIENCPMYFRDEWPGGCNLASSPAIWRDMFSIIDSPNFGLNYDPSHLVWQRADYIKPVYEFKDKIFHIHLKDAKFDQDKFDDVGFLAPPLAYHSPVLPGRGDIKWGKFFSALGDIRFTGCAVVEVEDRAFEDTINDRLRALKVAKRFISQFI